MKTLNDVYKKLLKEYPDWNIEYKQDNIILEKDLFYINANEDMVSIHKKYNIFLYLDAHCHPNTIEDVYNDIVHYINDKDILLKRQIKKDRIWIILSIIMIVLIFISLVIK